MQIKLNGEFRDLAEGTTISQLIEQLKLDPRYLAVERNRQVIPRAQHREATLEEGDQLEVVTLVGGG